MKKIIDNSNTQVVISIQIDKQLNAYTNKVLFPKKVENAHAFIDKFGLPPKVLTDLPFDSYHNLLKHGIQIL